MSAASKVALAAGPMAQPAGMIGRGYALTVSFSFLLYLISETVS